MRRRLPERLGKPADSDLSLADTQSIVAHLRGFASWLEFTKSVLGGRRSKTWNVPLYRVDQKDDTLRVRHSLEDKDWDEILAVMADRGITGLDAGGQLTDRILARVGQLGHLTRLNFGGTKRDH